MHNYNQELQKTDAIKHNHYASALENSAKHESITWHHKDCGGWALCSVQAMLLWLKQDILYGQSTLLPPASSLLLFSSLL